jgi:hypothetical protein
MPEAGVGDPEMKVDGLTINAAAEENKMTPPHHLIMRINRKGQMSDLSVPRPLLTLEEFFDGNDQYGSIGCNLPDCPTPHEFYEVFKQIRVTPEVADVRVEIRS